MRVLVCGGREYSDVLYVNAVLNRLHKQKIVTTLIQGGARGADELAAGWARAYGIPIIECKAQWDLFGKAAGHIRNGEMLKHDPDMVIAFPGGRGTANMLEQAAAANIPTFPLKGRQ